MSKPDNRRNRESNFKVNTIDLFVTELCNLECTYCFARTHVKDERNADNTLTSENCKLILDKIYELNKDTMSINFFGGEPLLFPEIIKEAMTYAKSLWGNNVKFSLSTNGTIFEESDMQFFKNNNLAIQVSIDGAEETNDEYRSKHSLVVENIKKLLRVFDGNISARMTYTPNNIHLLSSNIEYIYKLGVRRIMHQALIEADWDLDSIEEYKYQLQNIYLFRRATRVFINHIDKNLAIVDSKCAPLSNFCEAGKTYLAILPNGDTYPCHRAASNRIFKLGNIITDKKIIRGMFLAINKRVTKCAACPAWFTCHTCIMTHFKVNKDISIPIDNYCKLMNIEYEASSKYLVKEKEDLSDMKLNNLSTLLTKTGLALLEINDKIEGLKNAGK